MATMKDVAKAAGVSTYTVSAALSGASNVSPELRARVNEAVAKLGILLFIYVILWHAEFSDFGR